MRVPLVNASLTDATFELARETTVAEANAALKAAAEGPLAGILGYETRPLVSCDYLGDARSGVIDAGATLVTAGTQLAIAYDEQGVFVTARVDETDVDEVRVGAPVKLDDSVDGLFTILTTATKDTHGGRMVDYTGQIQEW